MTTNIGKNISKNKRTKYSQKLLHRATKSARDALKVASKKSNSKKDGSNW